MGALAVGRDCRDAGFGLVYVDVSYFVVFLFINSSPLVLISWTQKEDLAKKLNLKPRQVEVWFQNRRARIKVKQTEVDYEFLKKYCENLRDENKRLKTELQELRSTTKLSSSPFYLQCSKATTLTLCSSCNKMSEETNTAVIDASGNPNKLYGGFDDSSLTC